MTSHMWNLKNDTNELIYKAETDSQTSKKTFMVTKGEKWVVRIS